ncbi:MAG: DUF4190 domain-containing protein [Pseudonocardiaceae bacterium]
MGVGPCGRAVDEAVRAYLRAETLLPVSGRYPRPTNTLAIPALVLAFAFWPLAIVFGHRARKQIRRTGEGGRGLATAGLVIGYLAIIEATPS